ncbi:MAG: putative glycolipid-binding domain-containing protein [Gemmatimonadales bacterium]
MTEELVLWRRLDRPGHEAARLIFHDPFWQLSGTAVFAHESQPCRLEYLVVCTASWQTLRAKIAGWVGSRCVRLDLVSDSTHHWRLNGVECTEVEGCIDLDLAFSPATNLLPIRRLHLPLGQRAEVTTAWLRFPDLTLQPLAQAYVHVGERKYHYESQGGEFAADLEVNATGMVVRYPDLWEAEPAA